MERNVEGCRGAIGIGHSAYLGFLGVEGGLVLAHNEADRFGGGAELTGLLTVACSASTFGRAISTLRPDDGKRMLVYECSSHSCRGICKVRLERNTYLLVDEDRLYRVAKTPQYGGYELKLSSNSDTFEFFAFTFGVFSNVP